MNSAGWQCHLIDDFALGGQRILICRHEGDQFIYLTDWDEYGSPMIKALPESVSLDTSTLPRLPYDALTALAEAVHPGPTLAEVKRLEEALACERDRVDRLLDAIVTAAKRQVS